MSTNSTPDNSEIVKRDLDVLWHPCTQMQDHEWLPLIPVKKAQGVWLHDFDGNRYLDAISSWWVNLFGHANPDINAALRQQADQVGHVMLAGCTHEAAVKLCEQLVAITPKGLDRVFFGDNGSSAIEIALKMSFHYFANQGKPGKHRFISLENSYHGETLGALAVSDVPLYRETYGPLLMETITVAGPDAWYRDPDDSWEDHAHKALKKMEQALQQHAHEVCAVILEPLVHCAGGMRMYHPVYLTGLRALCDEYDVHLIADEVAVGFGRTGTLFACEQAQITPDYMCLSKGLTAGYLPLSVVLTKESIYAAFYDQYETLKAFLHSHSYTGNALACSVALKTISLFNQYDTIQSNRVLAAEMGRALAPLADHPNVGEVRQTGMIAAVELVQNKADKTPFPWQERRGLKVYQYGLQHEMLLRPLGNVVYFMPPYVITPEQIHQMVAVATEGIERAVA